MGPNEKTGRPGGSRHTTFRRRDTAGRPQGCSLPASGVPGREQLELLSDQRNEETRYEYLKDIGQDLARPWPKVMIRGMHPERNRQTKKN